MWNGWSNQNLHIQRAPLLVSAKQKENYICSRAGEGPINPSNPGKPASLTTGSATASLSIPPVFVLCSPLALSTYRSGTHQLSPSAWTSWKVWLPFCGRFPAHIFYVSFLDYTFFSKHLQISPFTYGVSEGMYHLLDGMHSPKAFPMVPWPHLSTYFSPRKKNTIQTSLPCLWCLQQTVHQAPFQNSHQHAGKGMSRVRRKSGYTALCSRHVLLAHGPKGMLVCI